MTHIYRKLSTKNLTFKNHKNMSKIRENGGKNETQENLPRTFLQREVHPGFSCRLVWRPLVKDQNQPYQN